MAGNLFEKLQRLWNPPDDEYDEYYEEEEEDVSEPEESSYDPDEPAPAASSSATRRGTSGGGRVVNINGSRGRVRMAAYRPVSFGEDIRVIADSINEKQTVILNLENTEREELRRILDFLSGVAYANDGRIKRVSSGTYIITPSNVELSGEEVTDELENAVYF